MDLRHVGQKAPVLSPWPGLGIGFAPAAEGCDVRITGRAEDRLRDAAEAVAAKDPGRAEGVRVELIEEISGDAPALAAEDKPGPVDILAADAGGPLPGKTVDAGPDALAIRSDAMRSVLRATISTRRCATVGAFAAADTFHSSAQASHVTRSMPCCDGGAIRGF